jgi:hypothetical protein
MEKVGQPAKYSFSLREFTVTGDHTLKSALTKKTRFILPLPTDTREMNQQTAFIMQNIKTKICSKQTTMKL